MPGAKREKSQHGYLPTVVDRTLALTRRCAHPMFMGCPRVAQRDAAPSQEACCDLRYARATAMSTSGPSSRSTSPKCRVADYTRVRIQPLRVLLRPMPMLSVHLFNFANRSAGMELAGVTGSRYPTPRSAVSLPPAARNSAAD